MSIQHRALPGLAVLALSGSLAACMVGPDYQRPAMGLPTSFHNAPATAAAEPTDAWWRAFNDPELTRVVEAALAGSQDLAAAEARLRQERALARLAGAQLLPSAEFDARAAGQHQSLDSPVGEIASHFPGYKRDQALYDIGAGASWEVDLFGGNRRAAQAAHADARAAEATRAAVRLSTAAEAADAYLQIRALQARLDIARRQANTARGLTDLVARRQGEGLASDREARQARATLEGVEARLPPLRAALEAQGARLDILMNQVPGADRDLIDHPAAAPDAPRPTAADGPAGLLRRRPDVVAAERRLAAADARIGAAIGDYYPKLSLSGLLGAESLHTSNLLTNGAYQPQAVAGLRWRLFDFGRIDAEVDAAKARRAEALAAYRQTVLRAAGDVETAFSALVESEAEADALARQIDDLTHARGQAQMAYENGAISLIEVLDADRGLLEASDRLAQAKADADRAAVAAYRALGGGWSG
jgi:NodT family efflux transporter outer membrane factor (OMF) lipoprotein